MSTYSGRHVRKKRSDPLAILLLIIPLIGVPVLGYVAYKFVLNRQAAPPVAKVAPKPKPKPVEPEAPPPVALYKPDPKDTMPALDTSTGRATSVSSAIDRVTSEVVAALELPKKVLVVWLLDQSASAESHRRDVLGRMESMYRHLADASKPMERDKGDKPSESLEDAPVLSAVVAYGPAVNVITEKPVADDAELAAAFEKVTGEQSHVENTFSAIREVADKFLPYYKQRFVVFVVVSDEAGDDEVKIDEVLPSLTRRQIRVHVVGQSATFGAIEGGNKSMETASAGQIAVRQGPESREPEWILLDYPSSYGASTPSIDTEMGPYSLQRLCNETGGTYFAIPASGGGGWGGSSGNMRRYAPAYIPEAEYQKRLESNKALRALVDAAKLAKAEVTMGAGVALDNSDDASVQRVRDLDNAMKPVARSRPGVDKFFDTLKGGEPDAAKLTEPRLKAGFDLAYGRAMAAKARADGFIEMCGQMKAGRKFQNAESKLWVLESGDFPTGISAVDKMAAKAKTLLKGVVDQYPNTPWAESAQRELGATMGYRWVER